MTYVLWCFIKTERKRANLLFHSEVVDKLYLSNKRWFTWWPYLDNSGVSEWNIRKFRMLYFSSFNINVFYSVGSGFVAPYFLKTTSFPLHWLSFLKNLASSSLSCLVSPSLVWWSCYTCVNLHDIFFAIDLELSSNSNLISEVTCCLVYVRRFQVQWNRLFLTLSREGGGVTTILLTVISLLYTMCKHMCNMGRNLKTSVM